MSKDRIKMFRGRIKNDLIIPLCILATPILSFLLYGFGGALLGGFLNTHEHSHYECACDMAPILSAAEASVLGSIYFVILMTGIYFLLKKYIIDNKVLWLTLLATAFTNFCACYFAWWMLTVQTTG